MKIRIKGTLWDFDHPEEMDYELYENLTPADFVGGDYSHWFVYRAANKELHEYGPIGYHHQHAQFEIIG